ncbi:MAG: hypothetical protein LBH42_10410 [Treponema sp.]|jgi:hypothetical protein|nr:hypothetical protein [Treponema sp.]
MENKEWFEEMEKYGSEIELAVQEWGIKNDYRLFGFYFGLMSRNGKEPMTPFAKGYYADAGYKHMIIIYFDLKEKSGRITITRKKGFTYPIRFVRTKNFKSDRILPVYPLYDVLIIRGHILPFESVLKKKDWRVLPFEDGSGIKPESI